jgi:hypothetical protein
VTLSCVEGNFSIWDHTVCYVFVPTRADADRTGQSQAMQLLRGVTAQTNNFSPFMSSEEQQAKAAFVKILPRPEGTDPRHVPNGGKVVLAKRPKVTCACVPCAAARAKCGTLERPCPRCVRIGITDKCVDKEHKKPALRSKGTDALKRKREDDDALSLFDRSTAMSSNENGVVKKQKFGSIGSSSGHDEMLVDEDKRELARIRTIPPEQELFDRLFRQPSVPFHEISRPQRTQSHIFSRFALNADEYSPISWANLLTSPFRKVASFLGILGCYIGGTEFRLRLLERFFTLAKASLPADVTQDSIWKRQSSVYYFCLQQDPQNPASSSVPSVFEDEDTKDSKGLVNMDFHSMSLVATPLPDFYVNSYPYLQLFPLDFLRGRQSANLYFAFSLNGDQLRVDAYFNFFSTILWGYSPSELAAILKQPPGVFYGDHVQSSGLLQ